jgi:hypothetical protein
VHSLSTAPAVESPSLSLPSVYLEISPVPSRRRSFFPPCFRVTRFSARHFCAPQFLVLAALLFLVLLPQKSFASVAFVQADYCTAKGASTVACTFTATVAKGDLLVANAVPMNTSASSFTISVSDNKNGAWTSAAQCFSAYAGQADLFYFANSAAGTITVTTTSSSSTGLFELAIAEYSGIATSAPLDKGGTCSSMANSTTVTAPSLTTANANDLVLSLLAMSGTAGTVTTASPFTLRNNAAAAFADHIVSTIGTYPGAAFKWTYQNVAFAVAVAFKASGSNPSPTVATPSASPAAGTYSSAQTITLSDSTSGAAICYTTDGSTPTATTPGTCSHGTKYSAAFKVSATTTVIALATLSGDNNSALLTSVYTISSSVATPTATPAAGNYTSAQTVTLADSTTGAVICYTTDGSTPTATTPGTCSHGTKYSAPFAVSESATVTALGTLSGHTNSTLLTNVYTITYTVATPTATPAAGAYTLAQTVTLSDSMATAVICYTTDGTTPTATTPGTCSHGTEYSSPFSVPATTTVTALATLSGLTNSSLLKNVYTITLSTATVVLCPNIGETGDYANCEPSPVLAFGNQAVNTASMAIPISINNCKSSYIAACNGASASVSLDSLVITGPNAADFTISGCPAGTVIATGSFCSPTIVFKPTEPSGTSETATLTVTDNASTPTQTMSLTGTSATVTTISTSSCPTALAAGNYQLSANISCGGTAFTYNGSIDFNLNGHTITYGTASQSTQIGAFILTAYNSTIAVHNGKIAEGTGINTFAPSGVQPLSSLIGSQGNYDSDDGGAFFNLTLSINMQYANVFEMQSTFVAHDNVITDTAVGTCADVSCRADLQSSTIDQNGARDEPSGETHFYNNTQTGGAQGGFVVDDPGATITYNYINPGNAKGTNTNDFAIYCWGVSCTVQHNIVIVPITSASNSRGVLISDDENLGAGGRSVEDNYIGATDLAVNSEYGGCALGGTFGIEFDSNPIGTNTASGNTVVATASTAGCSAAALRVSDSQVSTNLSQNNQYFAVRASGAPDCFEGTWADAGAGCAFGLSLDGPTAFTSSGDTFTADSGCIFVAPQGASGVVVQSPTCIIGSNPSSYHTLIAQNGPAGATGGGASSVTIIDPIFGAGTGPTDTVIYAPGGSAGAASFFIDWTQNMTVSKTSGPAASGAVVTFTDALSKKYTCTTNSSGECSVVLTEYRDNNDTAANQVENHNPYSLSIAISGCTTYTQTGISVSATTPRAIKLAGC